MKIISLLSSYFKSAPDETYYFRGSRDLFYGLCGREFTYYKITMLNPFGLVIPPASAHLFISKVKISRAEYDKNKTIKG